MKTVLRILLFPVKLAWKIATWIMIKIITVIDVVYGILGNYVIGTLGIVGGLLWIGFLGMLLFKGFSSTKDCLQFLAVTVGVTAVPTLLYMAGEDLLLGVAKVLVISDDWLWNLCSE